MRPPNQIKAELKALKRITPKLPVGERLRAITAANALTYGIDQSSLRRLFQLNYITHYQFESACYAVEWSKGQRCTPFSQFIARKNGIK